MRRRSLQSSRFGKTIRTSACSLVIKNPPRHEFKVQSQGLCRGLGRGAGDSVGQPSFVFHAAYGVFGVPARNAS